MTVPCGVPLNPHGFFIRVLSINDNLLFSLHQKGPNPVVDISPYPVMKLMH